MRVSAIVMIMLTLITGAEALGAGRYFKMDAYKAAQQKYQAGDYDGAAKDYLQAQRLSKRAADRAKLQYRIGESLLNGKQYMKALQAYEAFLQMPEASERYKAIAKQRIHDAKAKHRAVLLETEGHPYYESQTRFANAYAFYLDREYAKAQEAFAKVVVIEGGDPNHKAIGQFLIGYIYYVTKRPVEAREALSKVFEIKDAALGYAGEAQAYIGHSYFDEKNYPAAKEAFSKLAATDPGDPADARLKASQRQAKEYLAKLELILNR